MAGVNCHKINEAVIKNIIYKSVSNNRIIKAKKVHIIYVQSIVTIYEKIDILFRFCYNCYSYIRPNYRRDTAILRFSMNLFS